MIEILGIVAVFAILTVFAVRLVGRQLEVLRSKVTIARAQQNAAERRAVLQAAGRRQAKVDHDNYVASAARLPELDEARNLAWVRDGDSPVYDALIADQGTPELLR